MPRTGIQRKAQSNPAPQPLTDQEPAMEDQVYGLVSVLYHSLHGALACEQYTTDAEAAGDDDLVKFFQECGNEQKERGRRAQQLLVMRAADDEDEDEDEDEET